MNYISPDIPLFSIKFQMVLGIKTPNLKSSQFVDFLKSNEMIAIASAILITPLILSLVTSLISRVPFLRDHFAIGMLIASLAIFVLASMTTGAPRAVLLGISAGVLLVGLQSTTIAQNLLNRLGGIAP